jgi:hypothetical protein
VLLHVIIDEMCQEPENCPVSLRGPIVKVGNRPVSRGMVYIGTE